MAVLVAVGVDVGVTPGGSVMVGTEVAVLVKVGLRVAAFVGVI